MLGIDNWWEFSQHGIAFHWDGESVKTRRTPLHGQWGITRDDAGRLFYVPNSDTLRADLLPKQFLARNLLAPVGGAVNVLVGRDPTVWPLIAGGVNRGYQDGVLRDDGRSRSTPRRAGPRRTGRACSRSAGGTSSRANPRARWCAG